MRFLIILILAASSTLPVSAQASEEYQVFNTVIRNMFRGDAKDVDTGDLPAILVISDRLIADQEPWDDDAGKRLGKMSVSSETIEDFQKRFGVQGKLVDSFDPGIKHVIVSSDKIRSFFKEKYDLEAGWDAYYKAFPESGGYIGFSHVGFNKKKTEALLYFQHSCGSLCASGYYLSLIKKNNTWQVKARKMLWIS